MTRSFLWILAAAFVIGALWTLAVNRVPALGLVAVIAKGAALSAWERVRAMVRFR